MTNTFSKTIAPQQEAVALTETAIVPTNAAEQSPASAGSDIPCTNFFPIQWQRLVITTNEWCADKNVPTLPEGAAAKVVNSLQVGRAYIKGRSFSDFAVWFSVAHIAAISLAIVVGSDSLLGTITHLLEWVALSGAVLKAVELTVKETHCRVVPYFQGSETDA